jgi:hypothetical protein
MFHPPDISALQNEITKLEGSLDHLEIWLMWATGFVVVGLIVEYFHDLPHAWRLLQRKWSFKSFFVILGGVLITLGVGGELLVQTLSARKASELRTKNNQAFAVLNDEAAQARKDAGTANDRAAQNEQ